MTELTTADLLSASKDEVDTEQLPMQLNMAKEFSGIHLRGIYLRVVESGTVSVGDTVVVQRRGN